MLKIGDRFTEDNKTYEVIGQNDSGIISKLVTDEPKKEVVEDTTPKRRRKTEGV